MPLHAAAISYLDHGKSARRLGEIGEIEIEPYLLIPRMHASPVILTCHYWYHTGYEGQVRQTLGRRGRRGQGIGRERREGPGSGNSNYCKRYDRGGGESSEEGLGYCTGGGGCELLFSRTIRDFNILFEECTQAISMYRKVS